MDGPYEVEWKNNEQGHILYAICYCDTATAAEQTTIAAAYVADQGGE